jgi:hypothetical protein
MNGIKFDEGKLRYDLIPEVVPLELAKVMTYGANKYQENNWKFVRPFKKRYYAALMRHLQSWKIGEVADCETGLSHLSHALACLSFLLWQEKSKGKLKIYIASQYTIGDKESNVKKSLEVADQILALGFVPYAPLLSHYWEQSSPKDYTVWLDLDFEWIISCDALLRVPGESKGADMEVEFAKANGIPVYFSVQELVEAEDINRNELKSFIQGGGNECTG